MTYNQDYYQKNKEKLKANQLKWNKQNPEKVKKIITEYALANQEKIILGVCKQRAKRFGLEFNLTETDIHIPERCPYLDIPLTNIRGQGRVHSNASIDRIDSAKGYYPDNIQIISDLANKMKQDASKDQLIAFAKGVLRMHDAP